MGKSMTFLSLRESRVTVVAGQKKVNDQDGHLIMIFYFKVK